MLKPSQRYRLGAIVDYLGKAGYITKVHEHTDHVPQYDFGYYDIFLFDDKKTIKVIYGIHIEALETTGNKKET